MWWFLHLCSKNVQLFSKLVAVCPQSTGGKSVSQQSSILSLYWRLFSFTKCFSSSSPVISYRCAGIIQTNSVLELLTQLIANWQTACLQSRTWVSTSARFGKQSRTKRFKKKKNPKHCLFYCSERRGTGTWLCSRWMQSLLCCSVFSAGKVQSVRKQSDLPASQSLFFLTILTGRCVSPSAAAFFLLHTLIHSAS